MVTSFDKKRVMRKAGRRRRRHPTTAVIASADNGGTMSDTLSLYACLQDCIQYIRKTDLWKHLVDEFNRFTDSGSRFERPTTIRQIIAYGIGNFSKTNSTYHSASLWQLALVVCLREHLDEKRQADDEITAPTVRVSLVFFDPCSTSGEIDFLTEHLDCRLLAVNDRGNHPATVDTLFFMPHCPTQLYEHVVWSNYYHPDGGGPSFILLIGNSLRHLAETKVVVDCPCLRALLPSLNENPMQGSTKDYEEAPGNLLGAFNDTFVSYFFQRDDKDDDRPKRPYDNLVINDEIDPELL